MQGRVSDSPGKGAQFREGRRPSPAYYLLILLFTHNLQDHFSFTGAVVEIGQNDLLPCAQQKYLVMERDGQ